VELALALCACGCARPVPPGTRGPARRFFERRCKNRQRKRRLSAALGPGHRSARGLPRWSLTCANRRCPRDRGKFTRYARQRRIFCCERCQRAAARASTAAMRRGATA